MEVAGSPCPFLQLGMLSPSLLWECPLLSPPSHLKHGIFKESLNGARDQHSVVNPREGCPDVEEALTREGRVSPGRVGRLNKQEDWSGEAAVSRESLRYCGGSLGSGAITQG